jgi:hypothetical protein
VLLPSNSSPANYRAYVVRDVDPVVRSMPVSAVTETVIARWVKQLGQSQDRVERARFLPRDDSGRRAAAGESFFRH